MVRLDRLDNSWHLHFLRPAAPAVDAELAAAPLLLLAPLLQQRRVVVQFLPVAVVEALEEERLPHLSNKDGGNLSSRNDKFP